MVGICHCHIPTLIIMTDGTGGNRTVRWFLIQLFEKILLCMLPSCSFLAANSTQNYFLIARMLSFLWHLRQKCRIQHFATKWDNLCCRKWIEREGIKRKWGNVESVSLSISSFSLYFPFIFSFSLHFLTARLPGWHNLCSLVNHRIVGSISKWVE